MKRIATFLFLFHVIFYALAQKPILQIDFENRQGINIVNGIKGKAFNLGDVPKRYAFSVKNPLRQDDDFTIAVWVKGDMNAQKSYDILSGITMVEERGIGWKQRVINGIPNIDHGMFNGWKVRMQANGAWKFIAKGEKNAYEYEPLPVRQSIRDGKWHLLAISYNSDANELRFYYDGNQMAIFYTPELESMFPSDSIIIGNSIDSDHEFRQREWDSFYGEIDDIGIYDRILSKDEIANYYQEVTGYLLPHQESESPKVLKIMAFNILDGGNHTGKDVGIKRIVELVKREGADIFTLVETYGSGEEIADVLGYQLYLISSNLSIISRFPIEATFPVFKSFNSGGAQVKLPGNKKINVFSIWLNYLPKYNEIFREKNIDIENFLNEENETRGTEIRAIVDEITPVLEQTAEMPVIMGGDFNSGSHLDWIEGTKSLHNGYIIPWPVSRIMAEAGLTDAFREAHPDPYLVPGKTHMERNDRIDYIYYKGEKLDVVSAKVFHIHPVTFPSDHYGVSVLFNLN